ncbi:MAG: hypothetical protein ACRDRE_21995 [Pseudonocardiaceae bacterium]
MAVLFTDYRRPLKTFLSSFRAAIGLHFFKEGFAQASRSAEHTNTHYNALNINTFAAVLLVARQAAPVKSGGAAQPL